MNNYTNDYYHRTLIRQLKRQDVYIIKNKSK